MEEMLNSLQIGDTGVTTSGFYGVLIDITDEDVIVEFGNNKNCRIPMKKQAIQMVEKYEAAEQLLLKQTVFLKARTRNILILAFVCIII